MNRVKKKLKAIAENMPLVYEAGKAEGGDSWYDTFWDTYQANGTRSDYQQAFASPCWNEKNLNPKHDIYPVSANYMFRYCMFAGDMTEHFEKLGRTISFENVLGNPAQVFRDMQYVTRLFAITRAFGSLNYCYSGCTRLETIDLITVSENTTYNDAFSGCEALKNIVFEGKISKNISFAHSPYLTTGADGEFMPDGETPSNSVQNIIDHLADLTGKEKQALTLNAQVYVSETQKAEIYNLNWSLVQ